MTHAAPELSDQINDLLESDRGRLLSALIRVLGDFQLAEDALQDALEAAFQHWQRSGLPNSPKGWLLRVAKRKAIDRLRRDKNFRQKQAEISLLTEQDYEVAADAEIADERLRLIFTCCHPALAQKTRVALTLRLIGGLSTEEIARAFLDKTPSMAARLTRAKAKIKAAKIPYLVPEGAALAERHGAVLDVIYLIFNEGYAATEGPVQLRRTLCEEAIYLARMLDQLLPNTPETQGLLALMLLIHARRDARQRQDGAYIPLSEQNKDRWDSAMNVEGKGLVECALSGGKIGPFQLQAAIAALHNVTEGETDWPQIVALYQLLARIVPSPVVSLNLAIARAETEGAALGLALVDELADALVAYQPFYAARADLLTRLGRIDEALAAYEEALSRSKIANERAFLRKKQQALKA